MRAVYLVGSLFSLGAICLGFLLEDPGSKVRPVNELEAALAQNHAQQMLKAQPACFVPNLGQWEHSARFVHRSGPMTLFLEDRGWVLDLRDRSIEERRMRDRFDRGTSMKSVTSENETRRGVALRMSFVGTSNKPQLIVEDKLPGHYNYFLGNDKSRWRTHVPRYSSVRYMDLYPGIDVRLRHVGGNPEYDLLLEPWADLSNVTVHIQGAEGLRIAEDGSLVIETVLGPISQPVATTWQVGVDGEKQELPCNYVLLSSDAFAFVVPGWDGSSCLTIDPGLIWSTYLGGSLGDGASALSVGANGVVTVAGQTDSANYPTTPGAYSRAYGGGGEAFITQLDPRKTGTAQLIYSTFLGGSMADGAGALSVDANGVVTFAGATDSTNFPTTPGAYDSTSNGGYDTFLARLDPSQTGTAQLVYSTLLGGIGDDWASALSVDANAVVTLAGQTRSANYPTTPGAYDTTHNGGLEHSFVSQLDPSRTGTAQLAYSTFLGGSNFDQAWALWVDASGVVTVAGLTGFANYPTTPNAYDSTLGGVRDAFVSQLDPGKSGANQLVYSTFLGGTSFDKAWALSVDASGVITVAGGTESANYPTTPNAYDSTLGGGGDAFVSRLDPSQTGTAQLVYSTFLGGGRRDSALALSVDANGIVTFAGATDSTDFPTTPGAYDSTLAGIGDAFVSRLDPSRTGTAQLVYSTFLGGSGGDAAWALFVDASGVVTVAGQTQSKDFPTTPGAYGRTFNGGFFHFPTDAFVSRLDMGVALWADVHQLPLKQAGTQKLTLNAGTQHGNRLYWIFGSLGTSPGVTLGGVHIRLNPDAYTDLAIANTNNAILTNFRGALDVNGQAAASFNVPANLPPMPGITVYHAYLVYDAQSNLYMASNPVPLMLRN